MCIRCRVMIWKCIYFCNLPKSVFPTLCQFVPSKVKLSDCQREYSNLLYSAFYPIILYKKLSGALPEFRKDAGIFWHLLIYQPYEFIDIRNSSLFAVFSSLSFTNVIASTGFISAIYLRRIHIRSSV